MPSKTRVRGGKVGRPQSKGERRAPIYFESFSEQQLKVLTWWREGSPARGSRGIICDGAIRSGKTLLMSMSYVMWAMENFDGQSFGIAGKTIQSLQRNLTNTLIQVMRLRGYNIRERRQQHMIIVKYNGHENTFYMFGGRDESSQDLVQGFTAAGFFFDEVTLMPQSFVEQCRARCSVPGATQWFNCNPSSPYHWFKTEILDNHVKQKYLHLHFVIYDNPSLTPDTIEYYETAYSGVFYKRFILGKWVIGEGVVYDNFNEKTMVFKASTVNRIRYDKTFIAVDYGINNPTVFKKWQRASHDAEEPTKYGHKQIRKGDWVCTDEYYHSGKGKKDEQSKQKTDGEYIKDLMNFCKRECAVFDDEGKFLYYDWSQVTIVHDPSALSFRVACSKKGFRVRRAKNDVLNGISTMANAMNMGLMKYSDVCEETLKEFGSYVWDAKAGEHGEDKPVKMFDHTLDADRYFAFTILRERVEWKVLK